MLASLPGLFMNLYLALATTALGGITDNPLVLMVVGIGANAPLYGWIIYMVWRLPAKSLRKNRAASYSGTSSRR